MLGAVLVVALSMNLLTSVYKGGSNDKQEKVRIRRKIFFTSFSSN